MLKFRLTRRGFLGAAVPAAGVTTFFGPWQHNRVYAATKPIKIGITSDASGQYANSGASDRHVIT